MKICFIDDSLLKTKIMIGALRAHYQIQMKNNEEKNAEELKFYVLYVDFDERDEGDKMVSYYKKVLKKIGVNMEVCKSVEDIIPVIEMLHLNTENVKFLIDFRMVIDEEDMVKNNAEYKYMSLQCMDKLREINADYLLYGGFTENDSMHIWKECYLKFYDEKIPELFEREDLYPGSFRKKTAKKIVGV